MLSVESAVAAIKSYVRFAKVDKNLLTIVVKKFKQVWRIGVPSRKNLHIPGANGPTLKEVSSV